MILLLPYIVFASLFIVMPMIFLLVKAATPIPGENTTEILESKTTWEIMGRSIYLGLLAAVISLILAFPFAFIVGRSKSRTFRLVAIVLIVSPLFVFTIAKVFSLKILLLQMYDDPRSVNNIFVMTIGMVYLYLPFMIIPLYSVLQQLPESLIEASKDLGYSTISSIVRVVVPYALKAIFSGIAIVFMLSATSLVISETLVKDPSLKMIGQSMNELASDMRTRELAASWGSSLALVTIAIMITVYGCIYLIPVIIRKVKGGVSA